MDVFAVPSFEALINQQRTQQSDDNHAPLIARLAESAKALGAIALAFPVDGAYTRKYAVNPVTKRRVQALNQKVWTSIDRLTALNGVHPPAVEAELHARMNSVVECVDLVLRRTDRSLRLVANEPRMQSLEERGGGKKRRVEATLIDAILSRKQRKLASASDGPAALPSHGPIPKDVSRNFTQQFESILRWKPHSLDGSWNIDPEISKHDLGNLNLSGALSTDFTLLKTLSSLPENVEIVPRVHPYTSEVNAISFVQLGEDDPWGYECARSMKSMLYSVSRPVPPSSIKKAPPVIVIEDKEGLQNMVDTILMNGTNACAVDVEHHSQWSYRGQTCLIQVSTEDQDYIVDVLKLSNSDVGECLNQIFCCPSILKVFHGSHYDILWLQRDFGIYLVNTFDTFFASNLLVIPGGNSLANLIDFYCGVKLDKSLQCSDWRKRPLSPEMCEYARSDTHYLLYIFQCLRNQILSQTHDNFSRSVYEDKMVCTARGRKRMMEILDRSRRLCSQSVTFALPNYRDKMKRILSRAHMSPTKATATLLLWLIIWRDWEARIVDCAPGTIVGDQYLVIELKQMPKSEYEIREMLPRGRITPALNSQISQIAKVIASCMSTLGDKDFVTPLTMRSPAAAIAAIEKAPHSKEVTAVSDPKSDSQKKGQAGCDGAISSTLAESLNKAAREQTRVLLCGGYVSAPGADSQLNWAVRTFASNAHAGGIRLGLGKLTEAMLGRARKKLAAFAARKKKKANVQRET